MSTCGKMMISGNQERQMVYHPTLLAQCRARDGINSTTQYRINLRYTQCYYTGSALYWQLPFMLCASGDSVAFSYTYEVLVWTHTGASFLISQ